MFTRCFSRTISETSHGSPYTKNVPQLCHRPHRAYMQQQKKNYNNNSLILVGSACLLVKCGLGRCLVGPDLTIIQYYKLFRIGNILLSLENLLLVYLFYLSLYISIYLYIFISIYLSILYIYLSIHLSIYPSRRSRNWCTLKIDNFSENIAVMKLASLSNSTRNYSDLEILFCLCKICLLIYLRIYLNLFISFVCQSTIIQFFFWAFVFIIITNPANVI